MHTNARKKREFRQSEVGEIFCDALLEKSNLNFEIDFSENPRAKRVRLMRSVSALKEPSLLILSGRGVQARKDN
jgi:hypothetical protein